MKLKFCCRFPPFFPCLGCICKRQAAADTLLFFLPAQTQFLPLTTHLLSYHGCPQKPYFCCSSQPPTHLSHLHPSKQLKIYLARNIAATVLQDIDEPTWSTCINQQPMKCKSTNYGKARNTKKMYQATQDFAAPPPCDPRSCSTEKFGVAEGENDGLQSAEA